MSIPLPPFRVVSLFCGIGGADLGLYRAADALGVEVEVVEAIDNWEPAVRVYNANHRHPVARVADVKQIETLPECDLVIGGPPCQPFSNAGQRTGHADERNCIPDFLRLVGDRPYIMENVKPRLINTSFVMRLQADHYGDVTDRKRWFYSNYLLHVVPSQHRRCIRDIRDEAADLRKPKRGCIERVRPLYDNDVLPSLTAHAWHGHDVRSGRLIAIRGNSKAPPILRDNDDVLPTVTAKSWNGYAPHPDYRNPSIIEMARAHSLPDDWDWCGATKEQRGKMIANSWPAGMAEAVCRAMLQALLAEREIAA